jgi:hypothetical protein
MGITMAAAAGWFEPGPYSWAQDKKADKEKKADKDKTAKPAIPTDVNELSLEVASLQTLQTFKLTPLQLKNMLALANGVTPKSRQRTDPEASDKYRKTLLELRNALAHGDEDVSSLLSDQLDQLRQDEDLEVDDDVDIVDGARKVAAKAVTILTPTQIVNHLDIYGNEVPDPFQIMHKAMRLDLKGKKPAPDQWKEEREQTIKSVVPLLAGSDTAQAGKIGEQVGALLDRAYKLKPPELKKERGDLTASIRKLTSTVGPLDVIRNIMERDMAEFLSNPRCVAALEARMKKN